jgi:hypothetical protein
LAAETLYQALKADRANKRWSILVTLATSNTDLITAEQIRTRPLPTIKESPAQRAARETDYRAEMAQADRDTVSSALNGIERALIDAAEEASLDAEIRAALAAGCQIIARERPEQAFAVCTPPRPPG